MKGQKINEFFNGKKITLMGLGLLGRGVGDAEFLAQSGAEVLVTDLKTEEELSESVSRLKKYSNIKFTLGGHKMDDFVNCDMVLKSAGVPLDSPFIKAANDAGVPVEMSTALFASLSGAKVVGITGTRGKSTTTQILYEILKKDGRDVLLGGNVKGVSTLSKLNEVNENTIAVLELDSWQLQGFCVCGISPHLSIFTNFYPDHLNYYKVDMDLYFADKANIFRFQRAEDVLMISPQAREEMEKRSYYSLGKILEVGACDLPRNVKLKIKGEHNKANTALATRAASEMGVSNDIIKSALEEFKGVEGRMQKISEINGCEVYNDTTSTTPEATSVALETLGKKSKVVLIAGGSDKGLDMKKMQNAINKNCKFVCFLEGTGTEKFFKEHNIEVPFELFESLEKALNKAVILQHPQHKKSGSQSDPIYAEQSRSIILSPGFASFGMFKNEFDRGEQFDRLVKRYEKQKD